MCPPDCFEPVRGWVTLNAVQGGNTPVLGGDGPGVAFRPDRPGQPGNHPGANLIQAPETRLWHPGAPALAAADRGAPGGRADCKNPLHEAMRIGLLLQSAALMVELADTLP